MGPGSAQEWNKLLKRRSKSDFWSSLCWKPFWNQFFIDFGTVLASFLAQKKKVTHSWKWSCCGHVCFKFFAKCCQLLSLMHFIKTSISSQFFNVFLHSFFVCESHLAMLFANCCIDFGKENQYKKQQTTYQNWYKFWHRFWKASGLALGPQNGGRGSPGGLVCRPCGTKRRQSEVKWSEVKWSEKKVAQAQRNLWHALAKSASEVCTIHPSIPP